MDNENLDQLAFRFQRGDTGSFRLIVEQCSRMLMAAAYRYTQEWESARDLTQETWIKVYEKIGKYDAGRPFRNWLLTIHRNSCISYLRKPSIRREMTGGLEETPRIPDRAMSSNPHAVYEQREFEERLRRAMTGLSESELKGFTCVHIEQIDQTDAALMLGMKPATLRTTLHNARKRLAGILRRMEGRS